MIWNPTEGINLGFITIRFYSLMFVIAFSLGYYITKKIFIKEKLALEKLDTLFIWTVIATLVGARLGHVFFYQPELLKDDFLSVFLPIRTKPEFEFTGFQGLASHGAAIVIIITMYFYSKNVIKKPLLWILDRIVIAVSCGAIFVRIGNFFNSEIVGKVTQSQFGVKFIRDTYSSNEAINKTGINDMNDAYNALITDPKYMNFLNEVPTKHPAQLYEALGYIFVFIILWLLYWKTKYSQKHGLIFGFFLVLLWGVRFIVEYVKESQGGIMEETFGKFSTGQWLSIPFIITGVIFIAIAQKPIPDDILNYRVDRLD